MLFQNVLSVTWQQIVMWCIGGLLIYLAIAKDMEPSLLLPIGFGAILVNIPGVDAVQPGGALITLFKAGIDNELFPLILSLPTGSMREFSRYIKRLLSKGKKSNMVVTRFSLKKATNASGIAYSQAQFTIDRPLTSEEQILINRLSEQVKQYSRRVGFDTEEPAEAGPLVDPETGEIVEPLQ